MPTEIPIEKSDNEKAVYPEIRIYRFCVFMDDQRSSILLTRISVSLFLTRGE